MWGLSVVVLLAWPAATRAGSAGSLPQPVIPTKTTIVRPVIGTKTTITADNGSCGEFVVRRNTVHGARDTKLVSWSPTGCTNLTSVTIPGSVTSIGNKAFADCTSLAAIEVDAANPAYSSLDGVVFNKSQTTLIRCPSGKAGAYTIPNSVSTIEEWAFRDCESLTGVTIGNGVTAIGERAFSGCSSLMRVTIGNNVTSIGREAFSYCSSLTSVTIPDSVTTIGERAFHQCARLVSVTLGNNVMNVEPGAFSHSGSLTSVYFRGTEPTVGPNFSGGSKVTVYYLAGTSGWLPAYAGRPAALWVPVVLDLPSLTVDFQFRVTTSSPAPERVRVQRSVNLVDWEDWRTVTWDEGPSELLDAEAGTTPYRFYRTIEE
jgi:hypothetical protein